MKQFIKKTLYKNQGMTMIELIISMALSSIVIFTAVQTFQVLKKVESKIVVRTDNIQDVSLAHNIISDDFINSGPSFYFVKRVTIIDKTTLIPGCKSRENTTTENFWHIYNKNFCGSLRIILNKDQDSFTLIRLATISQTEVVNPNIFFVRKEGKLALNLKKFKTNYKEFLAANNFFKLTSFSNLESNDFDDPKMSHYAAVASLSSDKKTLVMHNKSKNFIIPGASGCSDVTNINNISKFIRCLPINGTIPALMLTPIRIVTYKIKKGVNTKGEDILNLYREISSNSEKTDGLISVKIATNIESFSITRKSIKSPVLSYKLTAKKEDEDTKQEGK